MSSRVGMATPASRSTARSSAWVGLTRSIQTAFSGSAAASAIATFLSAPSQGTKTENIRELRECYASGADSIQLLHRPDDDRINRQFSFAASTWPLHERFCRGVANLPRIPATSAAVRQKRHNWPLAAQEKP